MERQSDRVTPFSTWTDLPCGCSTSDRGSIIVSLACPNGHTRVIDPDKLLMLGYLGQRGQFGPVAFR